MSNTGLQSEKKVTDSRLLNGARKMSHLLDSAIRIPGTKITFGIDPILGMLPVVGDTFSFALSSILILSLAKNGASVGLLMRMFANVVIDMLIGYIPMLGDIFDFAFKANRRNLKLMENYLEKHPPGSAGNTANSWLVLVFFASALAGVGYLIYKGWDRLFDLFFGA